MLGGEFNSDGLYLLDYGNMSLLYELNLTEKAVSCVINGGGCSYTGYNNKKYRYELITKNDEAIFLNYHLNLSDEQIHPMPSFNLSISGMIGIAKYFRVTSQDYYDHQFNRVGLDNLTLTCECS